MLVFACTQLAMFAAPFEPVCVNALTWLRISQAATYSAIVGAITLVGCNAAQAQLSVKIIEKGVYKAETIARTVTKEATGVLNTVVNPRLISEGVVVYGNLGVRFGIRYVVSGAATTDVDLRFVIRFPPAGLRDPKGLRYSASEQSQSVQAGVLITGIINLRMIGRLFRALGISKFGRTPTNWRSRRFASLTRDKP